MRILIYLSDSITAVNMEIRKWAPCESGRSIEAVSSRLPVRRISVVLFLLTESYSSRSILIFFLNNFFGTIIEP